jgi:hypothetical protein
MWCGTDAPILPHRTLPPPVSVLHSLYVGNMTRFSPHNLTSMQLSLTASTMPYEPVIQTEAIYVDNLGPSATEDKFRATYHGVLSHWFTTSRGYVLDRHRERKYYVVRHAGEYQNPLLIVLLKPPSDWTEAGRNRAQNQLYRYMEERLILSGYGAIYGAVGIGLRWVVYKTEKSGGAGGLVTFPVLGWQDNVASDTSYSTFELIAELVYALSFQGPS